MRLRQENNVHSRGKFFGAFNAKWQIALNQYIFTDFSRQGSSCTPLTKAQSNSHFRRRINNTYFYNFGPFVQRPVQSMQIFILIAVYTLEAEH